VIAAENRIDDVMPDHPVERDGQDMDTTDRQLTGIARPVQLTAGEVPAAGVAPAIANAVHHATG
jgi:hypothetical protein